MSHTVNLLDSLEELWNPATNTKRKKGSQAGRKTGGDTPKSKTVGLVKTIHKYTKINNAHDLLQKHHKEATPDEIISKVPGAREKIAEVKKNLSQGVPTHAPVSQGGHKNPDGKYTPERQKLHMEIVKKILNKDAVKKATPKKGEKPTLTMLGGRGGAGKSWLTSKHGPAKKNSIVINPDDIHEHLPGYKGWNAAHYHEESSDIANLVNHAARKMKLHVTHDATMRSTKLSKEVPHYRKHGYEIEGHYMFTPPHISAERGLKRFMRAGRYVPVEYLLSSKSNEKSFDSMKPHFDRWTVHNNMGDKPVLHSKGGKKK